MVRKLAGPLALALLCVGVYWKLTLTPQYTWLDSPDVAYLEAPRAQFEAREWRRGRFPAWDPHEWCGQPMDGQMSGAMYPLNWPFYFLAGRHERIRQGDLHWYFVLIHVLAALNAYALCRYLGCSAVAAVAGGAVFSFGGFLGSIDWPPMLNGVVWMPLVFLFVLRAADGVLPVSSAALGGAALGMSWLSGHHEVPLYLSLAAAGTWVYVVARGGRLNRKAAGLAVVFFLFAGLMAALQALPAREFGRLAVRWAGVDPPLRWNQTIPYPVHAHYSLPPSSLAGVVVPGAYTHASPYVGAAALALAVLGVLGARHRRALLFLAVAGTGLFLALGAWNVFHGMLYAAAPMMEKARVPARAMSLFGFGMAVLAALGVDALRSRENGRWARAVGRAAAVAGGGVLAASVALLLFRREKPDDLVMLVGAAALAAGLLVLAARAGAVAWRVAAVALCALVVMETGRQTQEKFTDLTNEKRVSSWKQLRALDDVAQFLRKEPGPVRVDVDDRDYPANFGDWYGIDMLGGFAAGVTANIFDIRQYNDRTTNLLAVTHWVRREPLRPGQEAVYTGHSGTKVFRNPDAFPRVWTVHEVRRVEGPAELQRALADESVDLRRQALMTGAMGPLQVCEGDEARIRARQAGRVELDVQMACRGMAVLAETWYPGWRATVDGKPAEIHEVYGALRGVVVDAGAHQIVMEYRPWTADLGATMAGLGVLGSLALWVVERRRVRI